jgi:HAD superfamily hydrolase (TIGR01509 family)
VGPAAVLWDMDGTLVDTEPYWIAREHEIVAEFGNGGWTDEHAHALVGFDLRDSARYISKHGDVHLPVDDIVNLLLDGVIARVEQCVPWRPGARELLADLAAAGIPCALVTMSWKRFTDAIVPLLPPGSFTTVVAGDDVINGKPHPEPYLVAAERLGVDASQCVAIEDSPTGVRSAHAAGCFTLAVPNAVTVPAHLGDHHLTTLDGLGAAGLSALFASCPRVPSGAR